MAKALDIPAAIKALESTGNYRVLNKFDGRTLYSETTEATEDFVTNILLLDTETTGLDFVADEVIQMSGLLFTCDLDGKVLRVLDEYTEFNDPGKPISEEAFAISGISDEMVKGKAIDFTRFEALINKADLIIAHSAVFDRTFSERMHPCFKSKPWACSVNEINWRKFGVGSPKLEYLACHFGFYFDAHRADMDCKALLEVLSRPMPGQTRTVLAFLLDHALDPQYRIWAINSAYETKDQLSRRQYKWGPSSTLIEPEKAWFKTATWGECEAEFEFLREAIYGQGPAFVLVEKVAPEDKYSSRRGLIKRHALFEETAE